MSDDAFLSRWSKRKREAKRNASAAQPAPESLEPGAASPPPQSLVAATPAPVALPDVESLTPESDFAPFMQGDVEESIKRRALKTLFQDPRFNVMDGLDVYIDDYSKPDPLPEGWLEKMNQMARLGEYHEPEAKEVPALPMEGGASPEESVEDRPPEAGEAPDTSEPSEAGPPVRES